MPPPPPPPWRRWLRPPPGRGLRGRRSLSVISCRRPPRASARPKKTASRACSRLTRLKRRYHARFSWSVCRKRPSQNKFNVLPRYQRMSTPRRKMMRRTPRCVGLRAPDDRRTDVRSVRRSFLYQGFPAHV